MGKSSLMKKAIFLDRDGIINDEIFRSDMNKWTAPHSVGEVRIQKNFINILKKLQKKDYLFFVISNQPDYALGYVKYSDLELVDLKIKKELKKNQIKIKKFYYSFRHKKSIKKNLGPPCFDKKPNPFFLKKAEKEFNLDLKFSWIIGDRQTDIDCGHRANLKTIGIFNERHKFSNNKNKPDYLVKNFNQIIKIID